MGVNIFNNYLLPTFRSLILIGIFFNTPVYSKIVAICVPKCGSHLLTKCLKLLLNKESKFTYTFDTINNNFFFYWTHLKYTSKNKKLIKDSDKKFLMVRDPRDQLISFIFWAQKEAKNKQIYKLVAENPYAYKESTPNYKRYLNTSMNYKMSQLITNGSDFYDGFGPYLGSEHLTEGINKFYESYLDWLNTKNTCLIKFENLIGPQGGGNQELQINEIKKIAKHINIRINDIKAKEIANRLFGNTHTFRKGKIKTWKKYFNKRHKRQFKIQANNILIKLGYEVSDNW